MTASIILDQAQSALLIVLAEMESDGLVLIEYQSQTYTLTSKGEEWLTARNLPLVDGKGTVNLSAGVSAYAREHQLELWHYGRRIS